MDSFDIVQRYFKLVNEEKNFNYKYNPILNSANSVSLLFNKTQPKLNTPKKLIIKAKNKNTKNIFSIKPKNAKDINTKKLFSKTTSNFKRKINLALSEQNMNIKKEQNYNNIKHFYIKSHCPFCKKALTEKEEGTSQSVENFENLRNFYRNKKFKDIKSCFIYSVNNFPLINPKNFNINNRNYYKEKINDEIKENYTSNIHKLKIKKINMESELTKSNKVIKFKEIQRKEFDPSHFYLIKKPLIPSIRGKILRNTKKRFEKPMRIILVDEKDYEPYFMGNY